MIGLCSALLTVITVMSVQAQNDDDSGLIWPDEPMISIWEHSSDVNIGPVVERVGFNTVWTHWGPWEGEKFEETMVYDHLNTPGINHAVAMVSREQWGWSSHLESLQHAAWVATLSLQYPGKFVGIYMNDYYYEIEETEGEAGRSVEQFAEITELVRTINPRFPIWAPIYPNSHLDRPFDFDFDAIICNVYSRGEVPNMEKYLNSVYKKFPGKPILASIYVGRGTAEDGWYTEEEFKYLTNLYVRHINEGKLVGFRIFRAEQLWERPKYMSWLEEALENLDDDWEWPE